MNAPHTLAERIPTVCRIGDILRILQIGSTKFHELRRNGTFPIPEIEPALDSGPRFRGVDVQAWIDGRLKLKKAS